MALRDGQRDLRERGGRERARVERAGGEQDPVGVHDRFHRRGGSARPLRIEAQPASIWSVFLDRKFGLRLAVASAALVALLGTYLVTSEPSGPEFASSLSVVLTDTPRAAEASNRTPAGNRLDTDQEDGLQQRRQRDAVLVDLASYHQ